MPQHEGDCSPFRYGPPSADELALMRSLRAQGASLDEIGGLLGCSNLATLSRYVRGIPCPWGDWRLAHVDGTDALRVIELCDQGLDFPQIAERLGSTLSAAQWAAKVGRDKRERLELRRAHRKRVKRSIDAVRDTLALTAER